MMSLLRLRLDFFKKNTADLYSRYQQFSLIVIFLFGMIISQAITLTAQPILVFFNHPLDTRQNFLPVLIWFSFVIVWAKIHKDFINGGTFSLFVKTMPISSRKLRIIDFLMLLLPMSVFFIPTIISIIYVVRSNTQSGVDGHFWYYFFLIFALTLSVAKECVYGRYRHSTFFHLLAVVILFSPPYLNMIFRHRLCMSITAMCLFWNMLTPRGETRGHTEKSLQLLEKLSWSPGLIFLRTNYLRFLLVHWHDSVSRIVWVIVPLGFAWWLIFVVENHRDTVLFIHLSLGICAGILSGAYKILFEGRVRLTNFAKSTSYGEWILKLFDYIVVVSLGFIVTLPYLFSFYQATSIFSDNYLLKLFFYYLALLVLLGNKYLQQHKQVVFIKFTVSLLTIIIGANIL